MNNDSSQEDKFLNHLCLNYDRHGLIKLLKVKPRAAELIVWDLSEEQFLATIQKAIELCPDTNSYSGAQTYANLSHTVH